MAGNPAEYVVQLLRSWLFPAECYRGSRHRQASWIWVFRFFFQRQSSCAGTDIRIYPHALETRKLRRIAVSHTILLSQPQSLVCCLWHAEERSREHGLS